MIWLDFMIHPASIGVSLFGNLVNWHNVDAFAVVRRRMAKSASAIFLDPDAAHTSVLRLVLKSPWNVCVWIRLKSLKGKSLTKVVSPTAVTSRG
jgi:hypothetical protein